MLFSTPFFLFVFLPLFLALYWLGRPRRQLLLLGSMVFYAWAEPKFIWVVFASACLDYVLGLWIAKSQNRRMRGALVGIGVVTNVSMLIVVKYSGFTIHNVNALIQPLASIHFFVPSFTLPLGISFIVFEKITYLVDLKRGIARPTKSFLDYLNFVFLFPKLLAGPIIKYHEIASQLRRPSYRFEDFRDGMVRFVVGLAKKVLAEIILLGLTSLVFVAPGLLTIYLKVKPNAFLRAPWLRNATLAGVVPPPAPPSFSLKSIRNGAWQKGVAQQFDENFPGREFVTRVTHEAYLRLLRTTGINSRPWDITLGRGKNLFVNSYLIEYCIEREPPESLRLLVQRLRELQNALQRKQIAFVFLVTPSKPPLSQKLFRPAGWLVMGLHQFLGQ